MAFYRFPDGTGLLYTTAGPMRVTFPGASGPINSDARLWLGLDNTADASREGLVMDVMKTARQWTGHITGESEWGEGTPYVEAVADAQGYPQSWPTVPGFSSLETFVLTNQDPAQAAMLDGRYRLTYDGIGTLEIAGMGVSNVSYSTGLIEFDYEVVAEDQVAIRVFAITEGNHPRNFSLYHTKYASRIAAGFLTRPDFDWKGVRVGRFLGWSKAADDGEGYPTMGDYTWGLRGMPASAIAKVCNEMGVEPWVTIPTWFSDSQITQYATTLRDELNPALVIKVEFGNEMWNPVLHPYFYCVEGAIDLWGEGAASDQTQQFAGVRAAQCMDLFSAVFAAQPSRIVRIFGVHTGWPGLEIPSLDAPLWTALGNPAPVNSFDALAVTGYFGGDLSNPTWSTTLATTLSEDGAAAADAQLLAYLNGPSSNEGTIAEMFQQWQDFRGICDARGLDMLMYEGNSHLIAYGTEQEDPDFVEWLNDFNYSATMGDIYRQMMIEWDTVGDGGFNLFVGTSGPSKFGAWGAMRYPGDSNPRTVVAFEYNAAPLEEEGDGTPVGGQTVDTYAYLNSLHNHDAGDGDANTSTGNWLARLAAQAPGGGNVYTQGSQFGFANGWNIPPEFADGQEVVTSPHVVGDGVWTGCNQVEQLEFVPDNFEGPTVSPDAPNGLGFTYTTRFLEMIDAWETNASNPDRRYVIYAGWPDMSPYGEPGSISPTAINNYRAYALGTYRTWYTSMVSMLQSARPGLDIRLHDINAVLMAVWAETVVSTIPATTLFEDDAPHGRATWYFLAALVEYMCIYGEKTPVGFTFDPGWDVDSVVEDNYQDIVDFIWAELHP